MPSFSGTQQRRVDSHICIDREEAVVPHVSHGDLTTKHET